MENQIEYNFRTCLYCKHRVKVNLCACPFSKQYLEVTNEKDSCENYLENDGYFYFIAGISSIMEGNNEDGVEKLENALFLGISRYNEVKARVHIASFLSKSFSNEIPAKELIKHDKFIEAINHIEKAVNIDYEDRYHIFNDPIYMSFLILLDYAYNKIVSVVFDQVEQDRIYEVCIEYLEGKIIKLTHFELPPLPNTLYSLGYLHAKKGNIELAMEFYDKVLMLNLIDKGHPIWNPMVEKTKRDALIEMDKINNKNE